MGYFPFFMEINGVKGVIVGGGKVAARKAEKLLDFGAELVAVAPEFSEDMRKLADRLQHRNGQAGTLTLAEREVAKEDMDGAGFVIAATDDETVNAEVSGWCKSAGILVNVVDDREKCTFFFPALVRDGSLTVGISTDGKSPAAASYVRKEIEGRLPEGIGDTIELLGQIREEVKAQIPDGTARADVLEKLFGYCLRRNGEVTPDELRALVHGMKPTARG